MSQEIVNITYVNSLDQPVLVKFTEQGLSGYSGRSGVSGYSGEGGFSGISGFSAWSGTSGFSAWSGVSGFSGSGISGWSGVSGYSAWSGVSGFSAWSGVSGFSGESAWSGWSGWSGVSGFSAWSGVSGFSGESGWSGKPYEPLNTTYTVLVGGIAADTNITIPDGLTYTLKSSTNQHLFIWQDGAKVRNESSVGAHDADYYEVSTTQIAFSYDLPEDTVLDFIILE